MKRHFNPILQIVESRARQLLERYTESAAIEHKATIGSLREGYLRQFLAEFIPSSLRMRSGFVTDCRGRVVSPQIDLIVFDPTSVPAIALDEFVTLLPIEAVRLSIEAKSVLKNSDINQICSQQQAFRKMKFSYTANSRKYLLTVNCAGVPQFVVSFDMDCSRDALKEWFEKERSLRAVCVVQKFLLLREFRSDNIVQTDSGNRCLELMQLLSAIHTQLNLVQPEIWEALKRQTPNGVNEFSPDIGAYLTFDVPFPEIGADELSRD